METPGEVVDVVNLLALGDDLLGVLKNEKDGNGLMHSLEVVKLLHSSCHSDADGIAKSLEDYENKVQVCKEKISTANDETAFDAALEHLQHELNEKLEEEDLLWQEQRAIRDELIGLEEQRISIDEKKDMIMKREKDLIRARNLLSMCASVTNIIPNFEEHKISGVLVDKTKKKVEKFEFERTESPLDICNKLWKMA